MKNPFTTGDCKEFVRVVRDEDCAGFDNGRVHDVYSTFALARDAEWSGRLFALEMIETNEEGMGIHLRIDHCSPAVLGSEVKIISIMEKVKNNEIHTSFTATCSGRLIARGKQVQKILTRDKIARLLDSVS